MPYVHWIEIELARRSLDLDLPGGVDLNQNGDVEGTERTDLTGDGEIDALEWRRFLDDNESALIALGGPFKNYFTSGKSFRPDNPLHDLLAIEAGSEHPDEVMRAYEKAEEILNIVIARIYSTEADFGMELSPQEKLGFVYDAMEEAGLSFEDQMDSSLVGNIRNGTLDCDTSSFLVLAIAHEMGWPVYLVELSDHSFVRWDDGEYTRFNMDMGYIRDDELYISKFSISQKAIESRVYMKNLDYRETLASMYENRGANEYLAGIHQAAIEDQSIAILLNPNHATAYNNRGLAYSKLWKHEEALEDINRAIELDPGNAVFYNNRGTEYYFFSRYFDAVVDFNRAIELDPDYKLSYYNRTLAMSEIEKIGLGLEKIVRVPEPLRRAQTAPKSYTDVEVKSKSSKSCCCRAPGRTDKSPTLSVSSLSLFLKAVFE